VSAPDPLPPIVEFTIDFREHLDFMDRLYSISQQLGYQFPEDLLDKGLELPKEVNLRCSLDTQTGMAWIVGVDVTEVMS
jgi:hypothetical protein